MDENALSRLEDLLGYRFRDRGLLAKALTHPSRRNDLACSNERLEFLGDAVLGLVVSEILYRRFPDDTEGQLTKVKSAVVSGTTLGRVAESLNLGAYLAVAKGMACAPYLPDGAERPEIGKGIAPEKRLPPSIVADAFEAVLGAIYLDAGLPAAREFVLRHLNEHTERACRSALQQNFKSALQQHVQRAMGATPEYRVTAEEGPPHVKSFEVVALIRGETYGSGRGSTKKTAEQMAARRTLGMLGCIDEAGNPIDRE